MPRTDLHPQKIIDSICAWYTEGKSYNVIAREAMIKFNRRFTKGTISGVISRQRHNGVSVGRVAKAPLEKIMKPRQFSPRSIANNGTGKLFLELNPWECRHALGEIWEKPIFFCGAETDQTPWCDYHRKICYARARSNEAEAK